MSDIEKDSTVSPLQPASKPSPDETATSQELIEEAADEMAGAAVKAEKRFDAGHNIFTK